MPSRLAQFALPLIMVIACPSYADQYNTPTEYTSICDGSPTQEEYDKYCRSSPSPAQNEPSAAEIQRQQEEAAAQQRRAASLALNQQGLDAWAKGDWSSAADFFQQALENSPGEPMIVDNLKQAQQKIEEQRQRKIAAVKIHKILADSAQIIASTPIASNGLDFLPVGTATQSNKMDGTGVKNTTASTLDFMPATDASKASNAGGTNFFGIKGNPPNPGLDTTQTKQAVTVHSATDQLTSANKSGQTAVLTSSDQAMQNEAGCAFDKAACAAPEPIVTNKVAYQLAATAALAAHIPAAAQKDDEIRQSLAYYAKLDAAKTETQLQLATVQKQIDSGSGDAQILKAQKATLSNALERYTTDQVNTQILIKKRLITIHVDWNSAPASEARKDP